MIIIQLINFLFWTICYLVGYLFATLGKTEQEKRLIRSKWVHEYLLRMGPLYVKMGQILATRSDLIDDELTSQLRNLQDNTPPTSEAHIREVLTKELGKPIEDIFEEFSFQPVASASIAQVHAAVLKTGQKVAVKVVKKNVRQQLQQNLQLARFMVGIIHSLLPPIRQLNLPKKLKELNVLLIAQTDMKQEAENQAAIYANFKNHPYVIIPTLVPELCAKSVLVMEYMEGIKGKDSHQVELPASGLARRLQETIYTMLYFDGICHGDAHPGNIFFTKDGKIIFLDFGITVRLTEDEKWGWSSFYFAATRKEWDIAVERFTRHFVLNKDKIFQEWSQYKQEVIEVFKLHFDELTNRWSTVNYFQDLNKVLQKYQAQYTTNFTKAELIFFSVEGFASQIDPNIDIWANARKFNDRYSPYMNPTVKATFDKYFSETIPKSLELSESAKHSLIAPLHLDRYFFPSNYALLIKKATGSKIEDADGNVYVDLCGGYGPHILGYAHPAITTALTEALQMGGINALGNLPEMQYAQTIVEALPGAQKAMFSNSGSESIIHAIRLCRAYRKRNRVAKFEGSYHGFSDQGMVSSWFRFAGPLERPEPIEGTQGADQGTVKDTLVLQYGHPVSLERIYEERDRLACVICLPMDVVMCEYDKAYLTELRNLCTDLDIPLIFDEVITGFRVAYGGIQNLVGVAPDLTCLGKIIGGGLPCGAVAGKQELLDLARGTQDPFKDYETKAFAGGTMSGNSLTCTAGLAALTYLRDHPEIYTRLEQQTEWLKQELVTIAQKYDVPLQIKAKTSIFALTFSHKNVKYFREKIAGSNFKANLALSYYMRKHGVYLPELHTFMLSAAHTQEDLDIICKAFDKSLQQMVADGFFVI